MEAKLNLEIVTAPVRCHYPTLADARGYKENRPKFSILMLLDKKADAATIAQVREVLTNAKVVRWGKDKAKWPRIAHPVMRDGDQEKPDIEGFENVVFCKASSSQDKPPLVLKQDPTTGTSVVVTDKAEIRNLIYAGCYVRCKIFAYGNNEYSTLSLILKAVRFAKDGDPLSTGGDPADGFDTPEEVEGGMAASEDINDVI